MNDPSSPEMNPLFSLLKKADIPTLPVVATQLLELCRKDNVELSELVQVISADPGLAARIMRVVNSAFFGLRQKATSLHRAIITLGMNQVKVAALGFNLSREFKTTRESDFEMKVFWEQSLLRAVMSRQIAMDYCPSYQEEAFLIGLLLDVGVPLMAEALGDQYIPIWQSYHGSPLLLCYMEYKALNFDHVTAAAMMVQRWGLPDLIAAPICSHHTRGSAHPSTHDAEKLTQIAYFVGSLPLKNARQLWMDDRSLPSFGRQVFGLEPKSMNQLMTKTRENFSVIAHLFAEILPEGTCPDTLVTQAQKLFTDLSAQLPVKPASPDREQFAAESPAAKEDASTQEFDELTHFAKRSFLMRYLFGHSRGVMRGENNMAVILIHLDDGEDILRQYGQDASDHYIQITGRLLEKNFPSAGCFCRYGETEFVVVFEGTTQEQAEDRARQLGRALAAFDLSKITHSKNPHAASCCISLLYYVSGTRPHQPSLLLENLMDQLEQARQQGKGTLLSQVCQGTE